MAPLTCDEVEDSEDSETLSFVLKESDNVQDIHAGGDEQAHTVQQVQGLDTAE